LFNVASCWLYFKILLRSTDLWTSNFKLVYVRSVNLSYERTISTAILLTVL
jgi:hypothetical protein